MFQFVYYLKAIAALLITNSHYADIWPISSLALGGHIGNCIYFFLSGFCLYRIKEPFPKWYVKRLIRIYPALWIVNAVDLLVGRTKVSSFMAVIHCFIYPTWFHFIGSILLMYLLYYIIRFIQSKIKINIRWFMMIVFLAYIILYVFAFDKSYYHIDDVNEKWVRFMFFESMMLGALFREKYETIKPKITFLDVIAFLGLTVCYFVGKVALSHFEALSVVQFLLPMILVLYIASIAVIFIKLEKNGIFEKTNKKIGMVVAFIAGITLEIYLGQVIIIWKFASLVFPVNFVVVTAGIVLYAWLIHLCADFIQKKCSKLL